MAGAIRDRLLALGSVILSGRPIDRVLGEDSIPGLLRTSLRLRRLLERNVGRVLALSNLPSQREIDHLHEVVVGLEREITSVHGRLEKVAEALEREAAKNPRSG